MYKFVILAGFSTCVQLSLALPDVSLGYRYQPDHSSTGGNLLQSPKAINYFNTAPAFPVSAADSVDGSSFSSFGNMNSHGFNGGSSVFGGSVSSPSSSEHGVLSGTFGGLSDFGGTTGGNSYRENYATGNTQSVHYSQQASNFIGPPPIVTKHFWLHSAPKDYDEQEIVRHINIGQPRKNYNVVFINAPTSNLNKAKIIANVAPVEDKTAIYVLSKKANALDVSAEVATPAPIVNKPEVFFIKYKTPEEAAHAQNTIQAQYDALGGSSDLSNEGSIRAPPTIGSLGGSAVSNIAGIKAQQNYLPPIHN